MLHKAITILIVSLSICGAQTEESRTVTIAQGPVRGYKASASEVFQFFGIPYATAPTGINKFKAPLPAPTWTEPFEAIDNRKSCPTFFNSSLLRQDCLVANVLTPTTQGTNFPVVVYVHGGAYTLGSGMMSSPIHLVESQRVVAVTINYRLGVHGFLCLGTENVPGNAGLKDMLAGLRWVKENIASFGGNPNDVTLAGFSAGASAADVLTLSKAAEGLFNKVILESAAHVASWSVQLEPIKNAQAYAQKLNFGNVENLFALEEFYTSISYELLLSDISRMGNYNADLSFVPCIENDLGQERILDDSPVNIIKNSGYTKRPTLYGFANMEGIFRMPQFDEWARVMNENFSEFIVLDLQFKDDNEKERVAQTIKEFYFGSNAVGLYSLFNYINYFTDVMFAYPILRSVKLQKEAGNDNIYLYEYSYYEKYVPVPGVPEVLVNFPGATHCAQTHAVLEREIDTATADNYTEDYKHMRKQMQELWVNFITTGMPVPSGSSFPTWPPANANRSPYMNLGKTIELGVSINEDRTQFWDDIYEQYYRHPTPPDLFVESEMLPNRARIVSATIIFKVVFIFIICIAIV